MTRSGTPQPAQRHRIAHAPQPSLVTHVVYLVDATMDAKGPTAIFHHLGHKRQSVESSGSIECRLDLTPRSNANDVPGAEPWTPQKPEPDSGQQSARRNPVGERSKHVRCPRGLPSIAPQADEAAGS